MINGTYHENDPGPDSVEGGEFKRAASTIRDWITPEGPFKPDPGRYHLYAAWNCPWAHRVLLAREILGLRDVISVSYARPRRTDQGWVYDAEGEYSDPELGVHALFEVFGR
ncbi:MAG: glutathione-dependent reductase, partial [Boseongicola sp.]